MQEGRICVDRTAHYYRLGEPGHQFDKLWLVLHGYGQLANYFIKRFDVVAGRGDLVIAPEALSAYYVDGSSGRVGASWMTKNHREEEINDYIAYLDKLYRHLQEDGSIGEQTQLNLLGFSQGVATAVRWADRGNVSVNRLILWSGTLPQQELQVIRRNFPTYFIYGSKDPYDIETRREEQEQLLEKHLTPFEVFVFNGGHEIRREQFSDLVKKYKW